MTFTMGFLNCVELLRKLNYQLEKPTKVKFQSHEI